MIKKSQITLINVVLLLRGSLGVYHRRPSVTMLSSRERKKREPISSVKVEASTKDTWSSGHALPVTICRASSTLRTAENYIVVRPFMTDIMSATHLHNVLRNI